MKSFIKYSFLALSLIIICLLGAYLFCEEPTISKLLGVDISNIIISRFDVTYQFSLVDRFPLIIVSSLIWAGFLFYFGIKSDKCLVLVRNAVAFIKEYTATTYKLIKQSPVKYFLLILLLVLIYFGYTQPAHVDESMTYNIFIDPAIWEAICLYPAPNNHIFYSILANITAHIPWLDLAFCIRIPAILATLLTWILAYRFVKKYYSENTALFVVAIGSAIAANLQYSYLARGYALILLFVVICIYSAFNIIHGGNKRRDWSVFALSSILGAFTIPTFLYPFATISFFIFVYNYKHIKTQFYYSLLIAVGVFLVYTPLLVVSGIDSLVGNQYVSSLDFFYVLKSTPTYFLGVFVNIFYVHYLVILCILAAPVLYCIYKRNTKVLVFWCIFSIVPALCLIMHSVLPFNRVFFYYGFI